MANPKWLPKTRRAKLARLVEEMAEVLKEYGKAERFGLDTRYSRMLHRVITKRDATFAFTESNREALLRELKDLKVAIKTVEQDLRKP